MYIIYIYIHIYLEPQTTIYKWMFGETTIFYVKIWNHPIETSIYNWLFGVPGISATPNNQFFMVVSTGWWTKTLRKKWLEIKHPWKNGCLRYLVHIYYVHWVTKSWTEFLAWKWWKFTKLNCKWNGSGKFVQRASGDFGHYVQNGDVEGQMRACTPAPLASRASNWVELIFKPTGFPPIHVSKRNPPFRSVQNRS